MGLKRKYTITTTPSNGPSQTKSVEAECMKTVDGNVVFMDWNEEGCIYNEIAFFKNPPGGTLDVVSVSV